MSLSNLAKKILVRYLEERKIRAVKAKTAKICQNLDQKQVDKLARSWDTRYLDDFNCKINRRQIGVYAVLSGFREGQFIPEDIYYNKIEPVLNNRLYSLSYADKNFYERLLPKYRDIFPTTLLRRIRGLYLDRDYNQINESVALDKISGWEGAFIAKPSVETSGGQNIIGLAIQDGKASIAGTSFEISDLLSYLDSTLGDNFIIQEHIRQCSWYEQFNPSSLNTVRLMTYRSFSTGFTHPISAVVRFGQAESLVDNQASGGMTCGINLKGFLNTHTLDKYGRKRTDWNWLTALGNTAVPGYQDMCCLAVDIAPYFPYHNLIGFDFCVAADGKVQLIEVNLKNLEINFLQMNNGPLFGEHTAEIVEYCSKHSKAYMIGLYA